MTETGQDFDMVAGDTKQLDAAIVDSAEDAVDLTGATVRFLMDAATDIDKDNDEAGGVTITDAAGGLVRITLDPADTVALLQGEYGYQLEVTDSSGVVSTVTTGTVTITKDLA